MCYYGPILIGVGGKMAEYSKLSKEEARARFMPGVPKPGSLPKSLEETALRELGVAQVKLTIKPSEFDAVNDMYAVCINEHRRWLNFTAGNYDKAGDPEDGHLRKEIDHNENGMQSRDPKNLFHVNNDLIEWWNMEGRYLSSLGAKAFHLFIESAIEIHHELTYKNALPYVEKINKSYPGFKELTFARNLANTTLRFLRYDPYPTHNKNGKLIVEQNSQVAKEHYDRGIMTIQANASAPGFWMQPEHAKGPKHPRIAMPFENGQSQLFMGGGFREVYSTEKGSGNLIHPLFHGVDRIFDESLDIIPARTANILFVDSPIADLKVNGLTTQPFRTDKKKLDY
jgi:hypothetical protein